MIRAKQRENMNRGKDRGRNRDIGGERADTGTVERGKSRNMGKARTEHKRK